MIVSFLLNPVFNGWEPTDDRLGGTERAVVEWAEELANRDHDVHVYRNPGDSGGHTVCNDVLYRPLEEYAGGHDVCINVKSPNIAPKEPTIFYTNDVDADKQDLSAYGAVVHISNWAKDNIPVNNPNVFVVPHGYDETQVKPGVKIPKTCLYASSPDRGLDTLLAAWPKIYAAHPDASLVVTYGANVSGPGISALGDVDEDMMTELYKSSQLWLHPCSGGELFCITGIKAQAAGCWPVYFPVMALSETVKFGKRSTPKTFAKDVIDALNDDYIVPHPLPPQPTIKDSTNELLKVVEFVLKDKEKNG